MKILRQKVFLILLRGCWVAVYTHIMILYLMFILRYRRADVFATTPAINYRRFCCYRQLIITIVVYTSDELIAGVAWN
jgi:hypothetical protein